MNQQVTVVLIICLIVFAIFRRVRRTIGWQPLIPGKMTFRTILFCVIGALFISASALHPIALVSDAVGILLGVILAVYGAKMTQYEQREGRLYYRPNTWVGSAVIVLFFARLAYRIYEGYAFANTNHTALQRGQDPTGLQSMGMTTTDPWTSGLLLIMFAYYVVYNVMLMRKQKQLQPGK